MMFTQRPLFTRPGLETPDANLSRGMRQLNGVYTQFINRAHGRVGHLFQGRYTGIVVEADSYLLEVARAAKACPAVAIALHGHGGSEGGDGSGLPQRQLFDEDDWRRLRRALRYGQSRGEAG